MDKNRKKMFFSAVKIVFVRLSRLKGVVNNKDEMVVRMLY